MKSRYEPELTLAIQLVLYRMSVWASGASYGAKLQSLKYEANAPTRAQSLNNMLAKRIKFILQHPASRVAFYSYTAH
jgi:peroxin-2